MSTFVEIPTKPPCGGFVPGLFRVGLPCSWLSRRSTLSSFVEIFSLFNAWWIRKGKGRGYCCDYQLFNKFDSSFEPFRKSIQVADKLSRSNRLRSTFSFKNVSIERCLPSPHGPPDHHPPPDHHQTGIAPGQKGAGERRYRRTYNNDWAIGSPIAFGPFWRAQGVTWGCGIDGLPSRRLPKERLLSSHRTLILRTVAALTDWKGIHHIVLRPEPESVWDELCC